MTGDPAVAGMQAISTQAIFLMQTPFPKEPAGPAEESADANNRRAEFGTQARVLEAREREIMSYSARLLPLLGLISLVGCIPSPALHESINEPGRRVDLQPRLVGGKTNVIHFYADWCPACQKWKPTLDAVNARFPDMTVLFVNIDDFDSPVAKQYGITAVPTFRIVDRRGRQVANGKKAEHWLRQEINRRIRSRS
jgi:thiol-disulfide isomerase/thioredoxin